MDTFGMKGAGVNIFEHKANAFDKKKKACEYSQAFLISGGP